MVRNVKYIVTTKQMKEYDNNTIEKIGIPALVLMERAALALQKAIRQDVEDARSALIVCGTGNNGGDGLALARLLCEAGTRVSVCIFGREEKATEQFQSQRHILEHYPVKVLCGEAALQALEAYAKFFAGFDVVVDALFGVGLSRNVEGDYEKVIAYMNQIRGRKVAADIPSGIHGDSGRVMGAAFRADVTVTFGFGKRGMYLYPGCEYCGRVRVADIGISEAAFGENVPEAFIYEEGPWSLMPERKKDGNKGTFGKVLVIAGFEKMAGAAVLCAKAVLKTGAGMVKVLAGEENRGILQTSVPEALWGSREGLLEDLRWADVAVVGPGMGKSTLTAELLKQVFKTAEIPLILDADALNLISERDSLQKLVRAYPAEVVMTPHMGELSRLLKRPVAELKEDIFAVAESAAKDYNVVMVCKDAKTVVANPEGRLYLNITGNDGMATAGSGDVLSGMLGGILAQQRDAFTAATIGVYVHGLAGDYAKVLHTEHGVTASNIIENIE